MSALFDTAREGLLDRSISWPGAAIKAALVKGYAFDPAHEFVADITGAGGSIAATSAALTAKTSTGGVADADDITFTAPGADTDPHWLLLFQASAVGGGADVAAGSQRVIAWIDTGAGLPYVLDGEDVPVTWDDGPNRIFRL